MDTQATTDSLEDIFGQPPLAEEEFEAHLMRSLNPRGPEMLYEKMATLGLHQTHWVLDIGCGPAAHACALARRFGCTVVGVDPVLHNVQRAQAVIGQKRLRRRVKALVGRLAVLPLANTTFDFIWCRDMLNHVPDLGAGFTECVRVLKPGGTMLIYQTFATELLERQEAARLYPPLAIVPTNMSTVYVEETCQAMGLRIVEREVIASEWRERWEERGVHYTSKQLLKIARMQRDRARLVAALWRKPFETELADCHWGVYQMLGKLCPMVYVVQRAP